MAVKADELKVFRIARRAAHEQLAFFRAMMAAKLARAKKPSAAPETNPKRV